MGDEAKERLFQIRARDRQAMHESRANCWRDGDAELCGTHRACNGPIHRAACVDVIPVSKQRVTRRARVEVLVVASHEGEDRQ